MTEANLVRRGIALPTLSTPAGAGQILKGYQAFNQQGNILTGYLNAITSLSSGFTEAYNGQVVDIKDVKIVLEREWSNGAVFMHIIPLGKTFEFSAGGGNFTAKSINMNHLNWSPANQTLTLAEKAWYDCIWCFK